jgi:hypothetical protein
LFVGVQDQVGSGTSTVGINSIAKANVPANIDTNTYGIAGEADTGTPGSGANQYHRAIGVTGKVYNIAKNDGLQPYSTLNSPITSLSAALEATALGTQPIDAMIVAGDPSCNGNSACTQAYIGLLLLDNGISNGGYYVLGGNLSITKQGQVNATEYTTNTSSFPPTLGSCGTNPVMAPYSTNSAMVFRSGCPGPLPGSNHFCVIAFNQTAGVAFPHGAICNATQTNTQTPISTPFRLYGGSFFYGNPDPTGFTIDNPSDWSCSFVAVTCIGN